MSNSTLIYIVETEARNLLEDSGTRIIALFSWDSTELPLRRSSEVEGSRIYSIQHLTRPRPRFGSYSAAQ